MMITLFTLGTLNSSDLIEAYVELPPPAKVLVNRFLRAVSLSISCPASSMLVCVIAETFADGLTIVLIEPTVTFPEVPASFASTTPETVPSDSMVKSKIV